MTAKQRLGEGETRGRGEKADRPSPRLRVAASPLPVPEPLPLKLDQLKRRAKREGWLSWVRSEADEHAMLSGCRFSVAKGERVVNFFPKFLRHSKGDFAGKPFELLDWQRDEVIMPLFGWLRTNGTRRYRRSYIEIPKKNGKSTMAAGIGLYMLVGDNEQGAEVYSAATDRAQAAIVHNEAILMVEASPDLAAAVEINRTNSNLVFGQTNSYYRAVSSKPAGKEGLNGNCCICDELHVWQGRHLWDALKYMGRARSQPLIFAITTAGDDLVSVCYEQHEYAEKVLEGTIVDDRFFAYLRACKPEDVEGDKLFDRRQWRKANPSMGITIPEDEFAADAEEAARTPTALASFKRYSFNIWSTSENPWLNVEHWKAGREEYSPEDLRGQRCKAGFDLAKILDLTSLVLLFPHPTEPEAWRQLAWFWMPEATARLRNDLAPYLTWAAQGWVKLTPGDVVDYETVVADVGRIAREYFIEELAFDPWNAEATTQTLEKDHGIRRYEFPQTITNFAEPTKEYERLVRLGKLKHNGHPILQWQAGHVRVKTDPNGNIRPVKQKHGDHRTIDGIVAGIMALDRQMKAPPPPKGSLVVY